MNTERILTYLTDLEQNNCREWYHAHKEEYKAAGAEFEELIRELILRIGSTDTSILHNEPKDLTFRLTRDTRFSHDKSPYNPAFRAHIAPMGKLPVPVGYYLMIKPGGSSIFRRRTVRGYVQRGHFYDKRVHSGSPGTMGSPHHGSGLY